MITLKFDKEPYWLELVSGLRVKVKPASAALIMAARQMVLSASTPERGMALLNNLAVLAVEEWEGVGDADGQPLPLTPEGVMALLDLWPVAEAFERLYLLPAMLLESEKNG